MIAQPLVTGLRNQVIMLDADAADAVDVEAWLQSDDITRAERFVSVADQKRGFGVRQAQAVAGVMRKSVGHALFLEGAADGLINSQARGAGANSRSPAAIAARQRSQSRC